MTAPPARRRRSPGRLLFVIAVVAVVLLVTSHPQTALLVAVAGAVYGGVEGILTWRRRHSDS